MTLAPARATMTITVPAMGSQGTEGIPNAGMYEHLCKCVYERNPVDGVLHKELRYTWINVIRSTWTSKNKEELEEHGKKSYYLASCLIPVNSILWCILFGYL
jgi:hypothetical protein